MPKGEALGVFEQFVLLALVHLGDDAYGVTARQEIVRRTGRDVSLGAVYATLERLEAKGLVESAWGEPTAERGGRAKRCFRVTGAGSLALQESCAAMAGMMEGLPAWPRG